MGRLRREGFVVVIAAMGLLLAPHPHVACGVVRVEWVEADILHDLIEEFGSAEVTNGAETSVGGVRGDAQMDYSVLKRYLFLHPPSGEATAATATYPISLPELGRDEKLLLLFATGLKPGWRDADKTGADGVVFRVLVDGKELFEQLWDRDGWCFAASDLSSHAGDTVRLTLVCDRNKNSSGDWALWGDPRVVLLRPSYTLSRILPQPDFVVFETLPGRQIEAGWPALGPAGAGVIKPGSGGAEGSLGWFPVSPSQGVSLRLPRMKLPDGSEPILHNTFVACYKPDVRLVSVGQSSAVITPYQTFRIVARFKNLGEGLLTSAHRFEVLLGVQREFQLADHEKTAKVIGELKPGEEQTVSWRLAAPPRPGKFPFVLKVGVTALETFDVTVYPGGKGIDYGFLGPEPGGFHERQDSIVIEKGDKRVAFVRDEGRFLYGAVLLKGAERWELFGRLAPLGELSVRLRDGKTEKIEIHPAHHVRLETFRGERLAESELAVQFTDQFADGDSVQWHFEQTFVVKKDSPWVEVETSLHADAPREVALFVAPRLLAGDGSFGASKSQAIFPGLEYLGENEPSSSTRDIAYPQNRRFTPHPLRVTIPLMAVRQKAGLIGLSWDVHHNWYEGKEMPSPLFASPNRFPEQDNHLMALVVPSVPDFVEEGTLDSKRTLSLAAGQPLSTRASLLLLSGATDVTDAVVSWVERHGLPEVTCPRSFEEEIALCRRGFLHSIWDESAQGWSHCVGWQAGPFPGYCTLLKTDYFLSSDEKVRQALRERIDLVVGERVKAAGAGSLWQGDACHILTGELPFLEGRVVNAVEDWELNMGRFLGTQSGDGSWRWYPPDRKHASLGSPGDTTIGICARGACRVLREAIVTGNRKHIDAALKALEFLDPYTIPTGAQEWECPIYAPDVLAAAYAVRTLVHAFEITGQQRYLEKAKFWAKTGIPFIYLWDIGEAIPQMRYAGIPIFGATFHTHSWLGRPVQWCSLVYAYSLIRLAEYDSSLDWRRLAEGITASAMWQQYADGKSKGCYPDSWDLLENHPNPADVNPENILVNILALNGYDPGLKHRVLNRDRNPVFVTSMAKILSADMHGDGTVNLHLKFFPGAKSYVLIAGLSRSPVPGVFLNGNPLPSTDDVDKVAAGFYYYARRGWLIVALTHREEDVLEIRQPSS